MWALGDYPAVAADIVAPLGTCSSTPARSPPATGCSTSRPAPAPSRSRRPRAGAQRHGIRPHTRAARRGRAHARAAGLDVTWHEGDAEALPYADGAFDVTTSCVGVMFAPFHQAAADELVRVTRPGRPDRPGQLDPRGVHRADVLGDAALRPAAARPAPSRRRCGAPRPHVRELLGDRVDDVETTRPHLPSTASSTAPPSATTSRRTTARRSPSTARSPTTPTRSRRWMPRSPTSATGTSPTAS